MMRLLVTFGHFPPWDFAPEKNVLESFGALTTVPAPMGLGPGPWPGPGALSMKKRTWPGYATN